VLVKKAQILDEVWQSLTEDPRELVNGLLPVVRNVIGQSYPTYQFTDAEVEDLLTERVRDLVTSQSEEPRATEAPVPLQQASEDETGRPNLRTAKFLRNSCQHSELVDSIEKARASGLPCVC
jgi:ABC-type oligopeptide transport system substrate-binding subunit